MAHTVSSASIAQLQSAPEHIRNICILAHVDHGKTTLGDNLISSNGIISSRLAGELRYMDSMEDEQIRGITMKSSSIALIHHDEPYRELRTKLKSPSNQDRSALQTPNNIPYLINLIDSPGHVDFSMDVATAARVCDGALVVVDCVEGVCIQTHAVLKTAWDEGVRPVLVLNKIDRLITELQFSPQDAYSHLCRIIEQANVILSALYKADLMAKSSVVPAMKGEEGGIQAPVNLSEISAESATKAAGGSSVGDEVELKEEVFNINLDTWAVKIDEKEESSFLFDPSKGNVIFASAIHGWAFSVDDFAQLHCERLKLSRPLLRRALWGDYYYRPKTNTIVTGEKAAAAAKGKNMAVSLMLETLWQVYDCVYQNHAPNRVEKVMKVLGISDSVPARDVSSPSPKIRIQSIMKAWLPLPAKVLSMVVRALPSPKEAQTRRINKLWPSIVDSLEMKFDTLFSSDQEVLLSKLEKVKADIESCNTSPDAECVVFVSKMFAVPKSSLPELKPTLTTQPQESGVASESFKGLQWLPEFPSTMLQIDESIWGGVLGSQGTVPPPGKLLSLNARSNRNAIKDRPGADAIEDYGDNLNEVETFVAFARVFSGVLTSDKPVFVLGPKYNPSQPSQGDFSHMSLVQKPLPLYMMMGRDLSPIPAAWAGNVIGIGSLGSHVLKTATLSSTPNCCSLTPMVFQTTPLVRVAIEPVNTTDLSAVAYGLSLLDQADPCVEVTFSSNGEMHLSALGELHLQRCISDLERRFTRVPLKVSKPILSFHETLIEGAKPSNEKQPSLTRSGDSADGPAMPFTPIISKVGDFHVGLMSPPPVTEEPDKAPPNLVFTANPNGGGPQYPVSWGIPEVGSALHVPSGTVYTTTTDKSCTLRIRVLPLPPVLRNFLIDNETALRAILNLQGRKNAPANTGTSSLDSASALTKDTFMNELQGVLDTLDGTWKGILPRILAFGPRGIGSNMLIGPTMGSVSGLEFADDSIDSSKALKDKFPAIATPFDTPWINSKDDIMQDLHSTLTMDSRAALSSVRSGIVQGFQLATSAGPLCAEPVWGLAYFLEEVTLHVREHLSSGQVMSATRDACQIGFEAGESRLVEALYRCELQCSGGKGGGGEQLGKCYGVLAKRRAKVLSEDVWEGTDTFIISALLPVVESFGFSDDLRKRTSGAATSPQLLFSHWEILDVDPYFVPSTEEEREEFGDTLHEGQVKNFVKELIDSVRLRKGMPIDKKLVVHADKQRNLSRKK